MASYIFLHDGSSDDYIALLYLVKKLKEVKGNLLAVINAGTGEVHGLKGAENTARVCDFLGLNDIPLGYGVSDRIDLTTGAPFPDYIRTFADQLIDNVGLPKTKRTDFKPAAELFDTLLSEAIEPVTIVATGPVTDLALLLEKKPELSHQIKRIVMMGGAMAVPGNIKDLDPSSTNTVAEWNIWADPAAAHAVFSNENIPITLTPLDITCQILFTKEHYEQLGVLAEKSPHSPVALAYQLISVLKNAFEKENPDIDFFKVYYLWDPLAAMLACDPALALFVSALGIQVDVSTGKTTESESQINENKHTAEIAMKVSKSAEDILEHLIATLQLKQDSKIESEFSDWLFFPPASGNNINQEAKKTEEFGLKV